MATTGTFSTRLAFSGGRDGLFAAGGVTVGADGALYGVCARGGAYNYGNIYRLTLNGALTILYSFMNGNDGSQPSAPLLLATDGRLYGTANFGGLDGNGSGTVFRLNTDGTLSV